MALPLTLKPERRMSRGAVVVVVAAAGLMAASALLAMAGEHMEEVPLAGIRGLAVDGEGRMYVGCQGARRIQVYGADGQFVHSFRVTAGRPFRFYLNPGQEVLVVSSAGAEALPLPWQAVHDEPRPPASQAAAATGDDRQAQDGQGNVYRVAPRAWLYPRIEKISATGQTQTVVAQPWTIWATKVPFPAFLPAAAGALLLLGHALVGMARRMTRPKPAGPCAATR